MKPVWIALLDWRLLLGRGEDGHGITGPSDAPYARDGRPSTHYLVASIDRRDQYATALLDDTEKPPLTAVSLPAGADLSDGVVWPVRLS